MKMVRSAGVQIFGIMLLAAAWKSLFFILDVIPFNADEAVVALMARHILLGERPVFFYGQAYMGSLDAFLIAGGFALFGQQIWVIRLVQSLLYLGVVLTTILIGKQAFGSLRIGLFAGLLLAVATVNVTLYSTASLGGYGEALLLGNLILLLSLRLVQDQQKQGQKIPWAGFWLWGLLAGCGLWANGLTLVFSAPSGLYLLWNLWKSPRRWVGWFFLLGGAGFLLGSLPWWVYAASHGPDKLILELFGTAVSVETQPWLARTGQHVVNFLLLGLSVIFGFRPPWNVRWLAQPLLPFVLAFWMGVIAFSIHLLRRNIRRGENWLLTGVAVTLLAGFFFTPFGIDPSGRYFLPLAVPLALFAAQMIDAIPPRVWQKVALLALVILYQGWGTVQCILANPPGLTTQFYEPSIIDHAADAQLIAFLREQGETRGYTNYWIAYPLAFQSAEEIIFIPRLPYHLDLRYTSRDDRYALYTKIVEASSRVAYITTRNPDLDRHLRASFKQMNIAWKEKVIGDYRVYYQLSRAVRPQELGLGETRE